MLALDLFHEARLASAFMRSDYVLRYYREGQHAGLIEHGNWDSRPEPKHCANERERARELVEIRCSESLPTNVAAALQRMIDRAAETYV